MPERQISASHMAQAATVQDYHPILPELATTENPVFHVICKRNLCILACVGFVPENHCIR
jgi:hypothetical protein